MLIIDLPKSGYSQYWKTASDGYEWTEQGICGKKYGVRILQCDDMCCEMRLEHLMANDHENSQ
jgi:hypothetical protein